MKRILIAGGTGMIGEALQKRLNAHHYQVAILSRSRSIPRVGIKYFLWNPKDKFVDPEAVKFADIIVNLSGENIAGGRWTPARKRAITESRTLSNEVLIEACALEKKWPEAFISSGGMNFYGDRGEALLSEAAPKGKNGFLPDSCAQWERSVCPWQDYDVRTVQFRMGVVLSNKSGALPKMAQSIPWGIAPYFGDGRQWMSWIHVEDMAHIFHHAIENTGVRGMYNAASPNPVRNKELIEVILDKMDRRALVLPVPAILLQIGLGQMSETVLSSVKLDVSKLESTGFKFSYPDIGSALSQLFEDKY